MRAIFSEYGKVIVAVLVGVAFLVIIFAGSFLKNTLAEPGKDITNLEHKQNEEALKDVTNRHPPELIIHDMDCQIGTEEVFKPYERVSGVAYVTDTFGDYEYELDADGNLVYEIYPDGEPVLENGVLVKKRVVDTENTVSVGIAKTEEGVSQIKFTPQGSTESKWLPIDEDGVVELEKYEEDGKEYNSPGEIVVTYRLRDEYKQESLVEVTYFINQRLATTIDGTKIGGSGE